MHDGYFGEQYPGYYDCYLVENGVEVDQVKAKWYWLGRLILMVRSLTRGKTKKAN